MGALFAKDKAGTLTAIEKNYLDHWYGDRAANKYALAMACNPKGTPSDWGARRLQLEAYYSRYGHDASGYVSESRQLQNMNDNPNLGCGELGGECPGEDALAKVEPFHPDYSGENPWVDGKGKGGGGCAIL